LYSISISFVGSYISEYDLVKVEKKKGVALAFWGGEMKTKRIKKGRSCGVERQA
jgi:predicted HAD superfamily phosphohydrolase